MIIICELHNVLNKEKLKILFTFNITSTKKTQKLILITDKITWLLSVFINRFGSLVILIQDIWNMLKGPLFPEHLTCKQIHYHDNHEFHWHIKSMSNILTRVIHGVFRFFWSMVQKMSHNELNHHQESHLDWVTFSA